MNPVRTNPFRVKDVDVFLAWAKGRGLEVREVKASGDNRRFMLLSPPGAVQNQMLAVLGQRTDASGFAKELAPHLPEGDVAFVYSVGGPAVAIEWNGQYLHVKAEDIYNLPGLWAGMRFSQTLPADESVDLQT